MNTLLLVLMLADPTSPREIPKERQEEISRAMLAVQSAQLAKSAAEKVEQQATQSYIMLLDKLRKEFGAGPECTILIDKTWNCQKKEEATK